ncbi:MAG: CHAT domain-containing protein [Mangrovicoccus sp.]
MEFPFSQVEPARLSHEETHDAVLFLNEGRSTDGDHVFTLSVIVTRSGLFRGFQSASQAFVEDSIESLINALQDLAIESNEWTADLDGMNNLERSQLEDARRKVEAKGRHLCEAILGKHADEFLNFITNNGVKEMVIHSHDRVVDLPWSLLAFGQSPATFLGEMVVLIPASPSAGPTQQFAQAVSSAASVPVVGYAEYDQLESAWQDGRERKERERLEELWLVEKFFGRDQIDRLTALPSGKASKSAAKPVLAWLSNPKHFYHFNCHVTTQLRSTGAAHSVYVANDAEIDHQLLRPENGLFFSGIFFNACSSSMCPTRGASSLAYTFIEWGASAVCGTFGPVSDKLARAFAEKLYNRLSDEPMTFKDGVTAAREELWRTSGNPLALLYVFQGSPDFRIPTNGLAA